jgi:hypothetical protein
LGTLFDNIMVPVFSTEELKEYAEKASQISSQTQCKIHLLYVSAKHKMLYFPLPGVAKMVRANEFNSFALIKKRLCATYPFLTIQYAIWSGNLKYTICAYCLRHNIEMVIFFEKRDYVNLETEKNKLDVSNFLEKVNCPVLTVKLSDGAIVAKNIVVPIGSILPIKNLRIACHIGKMFRSTIHLVSTNKESLLNGYDEAVSMYKAYHFLHDNCGLEVKCTILTGNNTQQAAGQYAQKVNAEIVLLNYSKEPLLSESWN